MRTIREYMGGETREYIPKAFGNRDDSTPVKIIIKNPTEYEKRKLSSESSIAKTVLDEFGKPKLDKDGDPQIEINLKNENERQKKVIELFVVSVINYFTANGKPIQTGEDLAMHGESEFVSEVYIEIIASLSLKETDIKKLEAPCGCLPKGETRQSDGIALNVDPTICMSAAIATGPMNPIFVT